MYGVMEVQGYEIITLSGHPRQPECGDSRAPAGHPGALTRGAQPRRAARWGLQTVVNVARVLGMLDGDPELPDLPPMAFTTENLTEVRAPCAGLFVAADLRPGDRVTQGRKLGHIIREDNLEKVEVRAPSCGALRKFGRHADNCDVSLPDQHPYADEGDLLALIAQC